MKATVLRAARVALASALLVTSQSASTVGAEENGENWYVVRVGGVSVGTASERWSDESGDIVFRAGMNINFTRMGTPLAMSLSSEETCDVAGRFRRGRMESSVSNLTTSAVLDGDSLRYESTAGGSTTRRVIPWDPQAATEVTARRRVRAWLASTEPETTITMFDVSDGEFHRQRLVRGEALQQTIAGAEHSVVAVDEYDDGATTPTSTTWYAEDGSTMRTLIRQLGVEIVVERVTVDELATMEIETSFDIIRQSMVRCPGFPSPTSRIREVSLEMEFTGKLPEHPMNGPNQVELSRGDKSITLRLTRDTVNREAADGAMRELFLRPDRFVQSDAPTLRAVVDSIRAASGEKDWPLARAIAAWVNGHIVHKGMEHGYDSALDVYRTRAGDCTEHSLLTVALLRAAGIPARPVVGLAYGASEGAFVGHMWVEAYVDYWRTLDALDLALDPIRIRVHAPATSEALDERDLMRAYGEVAGVTVRVVGNRTN